MSYGKMISIRAKISLSTTSLWDYDYVEAED